MSKYFKIVSNLKYAEDKLERIQKMVKNNEFSECFSKELIDKAVSNAKKDVEYEKWKLSREGGVEK